MKGSPMAAGAIALALLAHAGLAPAAPQQAGSPALPSDPAAVVSQLAFEIRSVRLELQTLQLDYSARILSALQQEAQWLETQRRSLEVRETRARESIAKLTEHLKEPALSDEEHRELLEIQKNRDLSPDGELPRILAEKDAIVRSEAKVVQQRDKERLKWEQARLTAEALQSQLTRMRPLAAAPER